MDTDEREILDFEWGIGRDDPTVENSLFSSGDNDHPIAIQYLSKLLVFFRFDQAADFASVDEPIFE
jgi:hypothetical protein